VAADGLRELGGTSLILNGMSWRTTLSFSSGQRATHQPNKTMRYLLFLPLIFILSGCVAPTSQSHVLARAKAEVAKRESWGDHAFIRVERKPDPQYMYWRDFTWKVVAGAFDYTDYPSYNGIRVIPGTERELRFSRDGCLTAYEDATRRCTLVPQAQAAPPTSQPEK